MRTSNWCWGVLVVVLFGGCSSAQVAGGQSGTDADGAFSCDFDFAHASGDEVPLDEPVATGGATRKTPNAHYDVLEGTYDFTDCDRASDPGYTVSVTRGTSARSVEGLLNGSVPSPMCPGLQLDAVVHIEAADGSVSHDATFVTAFLGAYLIAGHATADDGADVSFRLMTDGSAAGQVERLSIAHGTMGSSCRLKTEPSGEGGDSSGGAGGVDGG